MAAGSAAGGPAARVPPSGGPPGTAAKRAARANVPLAQSDNERARGLVNLDAKFVVDPAAMSPKAASYFRHRPFLTPEVCKRWRMGYLPRDAGGDHAGGTMRGKIVYPMLSESGEVLTWFGRDPEYEGKYPRVDCRREAGERAGEVPLRKGLPARPGTFRAAPVRRRSVPRVGAVHGLVGPGRPERRDGPGCVGCRSGRPVRDERHRGTGGEDRCLCSGDGRGGNGAVRLHGGGRVGRTGGVGRTGPTLSCAPSLVVSNAWRGIQSQEGGFADK